MDARQWRSSGDQFRKFEQAPAQFIHLHAEEADRKATRGALGLDPSAGISWALAELSEERGVNHSQRTRDPGIFQLIDPMAQSIELKQHMRCEKLPIFGSVSFRRTDLRLLARLSVLLHLCSRGPKGLNEPRARAGRFEPRQLNRERAQVAADRASTEGPRFDHHGPAPAEQIEDGVPRTGPICDQAACRVRVQTRWVAVKTVNVRLYPRLACRDFQGTAQGLRNSRSPRPDRNLSAHMGERAPLPGLLSRSLRDRSVGSPHAAELDPEALPGKAHYRPTGWR